MTYLSTECHKRAQSIRSELNAAQQRVAKKIAKLFPIGALVLIGADGRSFTMRVTRYGSIWCEPTTVYGVNVATGKDRRFYAGTDLVLRVDLPKKGGAK